MRKGTSSVGTRMVGANPGQGLHKATDLTLSVLLALHDCCQ